MGEARVHNYAFRKTLAYVKNKKGKLENENIRQTFESATHYKLAARPPYLPTYYPLNSFVMLLQIIINRFGDEKALYEDKKTKRCCDMGYYLYTGPEEKDSPYHYLDPRKPLIEVLTDFYNNLRTPSGIFQNCGSTFSIEGSKIRAVWEGCTGNDEFFFYLEGVHEGMIKCSHGRGVLLAKKGKDAFIYEIKVEE
jgi:hypothetical protein